MEKLSNISLDLIITYLINFAYVILRALTYAISCYSAIWVLDKLVGVNLVKEVCIEKNTGAAILIASIFWGLAYIIGQI